MEIGLLLLYYYYIIIISLEQLQNILLESSLTLDIIVALDSHEVAQACREIKHTK